MKYATRGSYIWKSVEESTILRLGKTLASELNSSADSLSIGWTKIILSLFICSLYCQSQVNLKLDPKLIMKKLNFLNTPIIWNRFPY